MADPRIVLVTHGAEKLGLKGLVKGTIKYGAIGSLFFYAGTKGATIDNIHRVPLPLTADQKHFMVPVSEADGSGNVVYSLSAKKTVLVHYMDRKSGDLAPDLNDNTKHAVYDSGLTPEKFKEELDKAEARINSPEAKAERQKHPAARVWQNGREFVEEIATGKSVETLRREEAEKPDALQKLWNNLKQFMPVIGGGAALAIGLGSGGSIGGLLLAAAVGGGLAFSEKIVNHFNKPAAPTPEPQPNAAAAAGGAQPAAPGAGPAQTQQQGGPAPGPAGNNVSNPDEQNPAAKPRDEVTLKTPSIPGMQEASYDQPFNSGLAVNAKGVKIQLGGGTVAG